MYVYSLSLSPTHTHTHTHTHAHLYICVYTQTFQETFGLSEEETEAPPALMTVNFDGDIVTAHSMVYLKYIQE